MTSSLNPRFTFDTFVVGAANRLAVTAGRTVAENPGSAYNPLFIYSALGTPPRRSPRSSTSST